MLVCHPYSRKTVLVALNPFTSASLKSKFEAEVSPLKTLPENSTGSLSSPPVSQGQYQANKEVLPSMHHCLSRGK